LNAPFLLWKWKPVGTLSSAEVPKGLDLKNKKLGVCAFLSERESAIRAHEPSDELSSKEVERIDEVLA
jgi:hypothetical protein